ncbi:MAG: nucleotide exchange factor GrpE [Planctomycetes bacterium RBG_13_63_9]|nr:MAG: nucleotide exchange factor GrpE [Planctomycetes bacterium RBG_13_63_9]
MSRKKPTKTHPGSHPEFDRVAAEQMAADMAAAVENQQGVESGTVASLQAELEAAKDRELRTQAELENYRKRVARQMEEERRYADLPLLRDLLPVLDNMERAIEAAEKTHDTASLLAGVKMVAGQLEEVLERHRCIRIEALNEPFNPHLHEAISQRPADERPANTVLAVIQSGFRLHDRVVRPSQVIVSMASSRDEADQDDSDMDDERTDDHADL